MLNHRRHRQDAICSTAGFFLPRLAREHYQGDAVVHWTLTLFDRARGWLTEELHQRFRELMLHTAAREALFCPVYCLMPDHLHLVWMGLRLDSDQINGMAFLRTYLEPALVSAKFQPQAQDHVLRANQRKQNAFSRVCFYIAANPVQAELVNRAEDWRFTGCIVPGYPNLHPLKSDLLAEILEALRQAEIARRGKYSSTASLRQKRRKAGQDARTYGSE